MKFIKNNRPQQEENYVSYRCNANGCKLNGSISVAQDKWTCFLHFRADSTNWPMVTETVRMNEDLFGIIGDLRKISEIEWAAEMPNNGITQPAQRNLFMHLFDDRPHLKPFPDEKKIHYEYRLLDHISEEAGVLTKKKEQSFVKTKKLTEFHNPAEFF